MYSVRDVTDEIKRRYRPRPNGKLESFLFLTFVIYGGTGYMIAHLIFPGDGWIGILFICLALLLWAFTADKLLKSLKVK